MYILQLWFLLINTFKTIASLEQTCNALRLLPGENKLKFFFSTREHAIPLFLQAKCYLVYDIRAQKAPINLLNQFLKASTIHNYNTSSMNECFSVKFSKTENKMKKTLYKNWRLS